MYLAKGLLYKTFFKPVIDWSLALIAVIFLSPLLVVVAIAIKYDTHGPVLFRQERLGRYGKVFIIYKFRSMSIQKIKDINNNKLFENDPRITKVGRIIRKTSIDEIPQIFNILKGEMSFIGPRPPVTYFPKKIEEYSEFEYQRFLVKPGISGLAQVKCRDIHDWEINIPIDIEYVNKYSFFYDLKLFIRSLTVFFKVDNVYRKE